MERYKVIAKNSKITRNRIDAELKAYEEDMKNKIQ